MALSLSKKGNKVIATKLKTKIKYAQAGHLLFAEKVEAAKEWESHVEPITVLQKAGFDLVKPTQIALAILKAKVAIEKDRPDEACAVMHPLGKNLAIAVEESQLVEFTAFDAIEASVLDGFDERPTPQVFTTGTETGQFDGLNPLLSAIEAITSDPGDIVAAFQKVFVLNDYVQTLVENGDSTSQEVMDLCTSFNKSYDDGTLAALPITVRHAVGEIRSCLRGLAAVLNVQPYAFSSIYEDVEKL